MSAEVALTFLLQTLKDILGDYKNLKSGAKNEFDQLKNELCRLEAFLKDAAKKPEKSGEIREKERQIRELVYEVQDAIDIYVTRTAAALTKNIFRRVLVMMSPKMEQKVRYLRLQKVVPMLTSMGLLTGNGTSGGALELSATGETEDPQAGSSSSTSNNNTNSIYLEVEEQNTIIGHLMNSSEKLDVISITGEAGVGKTTLAWNIFVDPNVMNAFTLRIWIDKNSMKCDRRDVHIEILRNLGHSVTPVMEDEWLPKIARRCLEKEKFLLVVDDVRAVETWEFIEECLPTTNRTSKVILTSRETIVAATTIAHVNMICQQLNRLSDERSWELLKSCVFGEINTCPPELEDVGNSIAKFCGGLPEIIVLIGGILKDQIPLLENWLEFSERVKEISVPNMEFIPDVIELADNELDDLRVESISDVIELAYNKLSDDLRVCFLYTGLFPRDHEIQVSTLTQLWIAERFIHPENGKSFEEALKIAQKYLNDLINQKLIVAAKMRLDQVKTCRVQDNIRQFCIAKAMEENLFTVIEPPVYQVENLYRLCFHSDPSEFLSEKKPPHVRSFFCLLKNPILLRKEDISTIGNTFKPLRVLNCKSTKFEKFPNITRLILLKHITLSIEKLDFLPEKISQLINLQTLVVETKSSFIKVKANIWKMKNLIHLKTKVVFILDDEKWKGTATNLRTISRLSPSSCLPDLFKKAPNLKSLGIRGELTLEHLETLSLVNFRKLEKLKLENEVRYGEASNHPLVSLPGRFPNNLKSLTLSKTYLKWSNHISELAKINTLEVLKLREGAFTGFSWNAYSNIFHSLQYLLMEKMDLVNWEASTDHFPKLKCLVTRTCVDLKVPESLKDLLMN